MSKEDRVFPIRSVLSSPSNSANNSVTELIKPLHDTTLDSQSFLVWSNGRFVRCDEEPIHIPGTIQSYGALIAVEEDTWVVRQVSENTGSLLGLEPALLLNSGSLRDFISDAQANELLGHLESVSFFPEEAGPEVIPFEFLRPDQEPLSCICAMHRYQKNPGLIIMEFEMGKDGHFPHSMKSSSDLTQSLDAQEHLRQRNDTKLALDSMMGVFNVISKVNAFLSTMKNVQSLAREVARIVRQITGFDRVLVYEFDGDWNGEVIAESLVAGDYPSFMGLHFPSTDIPKQARELYVKNKIRLLYSRDLKTSRILCRSQEDLKTPLDLSFSYLRSMSLIHLKYLRNMGVESSMSISLIGFGKLWGLIACHGYSPRRVSLFTRKFCRMLGDTASKLIEGISYEKRLLSRQVITAKAAERIAMGKDMNEYIVAKAEDLLELFASGDLAVISIEDEAKVMGMVEDSNEIVALVDYLRMKQFLDLTHTDCIHEQWPDFPFQSSAIAGILHIPLSRGGKDFITFIRKEQLKHVHWAGRPTKPADDLSQLEPRSSFQKWTQVVSRRSKTWSQDEFEVATVLQLVYWKFIDIWRQRDAAVQSNRLKNLLLANVSHEVRTPLNAIINYLEIALETDMSPELRSAIMQAHRSSKSLIFIINDLLDLTRIEAGKMLFRAEPFNFMNTVRDAARMFEIDALRKNVAFEIVEEENFPEIVIGDSSKIRQIVVNLCCNAMKFTTEGSVKLFCRHFDRTEAQVSVELMVIDTGIGIPHDKLSVIFEDFEQIESSLSKTVQGAGLGLAIVARIVRNMNGQLRVESEPNKGSRFTLTLTFPLIMPETNSSTSSPTTGDPSAEKKKTKDLSSVDEYGVASPLSHIEGQKVIMKEGSPAQTKPSAKKDFMYTPEFNHKKMAMDEINWKNEGAAVPLEPSVAATLENQSLNILYAEDDTVNQKIIEKRLEKLNHKVFVCQNGKECVDVFRSRPTDFDVILMDVQMPLCNGLEATSLIREIERSRSIDNLPVTHRLNRHRIPIVAVSASVYDSDVGACIDAGMDGFVNKPVDVKLLNRLLLSSLNRKAREAMIMVESNERQEGAWFEDRNLHI